MVGYVALVDGWSSPLPYRWVSVQIMPEWHGPYHYPHSDYLLEQLSPVRSSKGGWMADSVLTWRYGCAEAPAPLCAAPMAHVALPA